MDLRKLVLIRLQQAVLFPGHRGPFFVHESMELIHFLRNLLLTTRILRPITLLPSSCSVSYTDDRAFSTRDRVLSPYLDKTY